MSGLPVEYEYTHDPSGDVTPNDRDALADRLNDAFAAGDVTMDDYKARLQALFDATKRAELVPVLDGLPARYRLNEPALGGDNVGRPGQVEPLSPAPRGLVRAGVVTGGVLVLLVIVLLVLLL